MKHPVIAGFPIRDAILNGLLFRYFWTFEAADFWHLKAAPVREWKDYTLKERIEILKAHHKYGENLTETLFKLKHFSVVMKHLVELQSRNWFEKRSSWKNLVMWRIKLIAQRQVRILRL